MTKSREIGLRNQCTGLFFPRFQLSEEASEGRGSREAERLLGFPGNTLASRLQGVASGKGHTRRKIKRNAEVLADAQISIDVDGGLGKKK